MQEEEYQISATLDKESESKLIRLAKKFDRSVSAQLRVIIKEYQE